MTKSPLVQQQHKQFKFDQTIESKTHNQPATKQLNNNNNNNNSSVNSGTKISINHHHINNCINNNNNNNISNENAKLNLNRGSAGTPKRRLSYHNISTPTMDDTEMQVSNDNQPTPTLSCEGLSASTSDLSPSSEKCSGSNSNSLTPFIKRKCFSKDISQFKSSSTNENNQNSPYSISSVNLKTKSFEVVSSESPKLLNERLNESFETLQLASQENNSKMGRFSSRRRGSLTFCKHKSAPLTCLSNSDEKSIKLAIKNNQMASPSKYMFQSQTNQHQPLNDISNHIKHKSSLTNSMLQNSFKMVEEGTLNEEQRDDVADLENLIYGNSSSVQTTTVTYYNQQFIKQSLEIDAAHQNLIGDRSKRHILPVVSSAKHQDLYCISSETLVDVLEGKYEDLIDECIIIDSRYPYEYDGGHIANALNIYTKERLYEEMFIKRVKSKYVTSKFSTSISCSCLSTISKKCNDSQCQMISNSEVKTNEDINEINIAKRVIIIFHCEFSSERGPTLLRFLRNQDRTLNEHCYPTLYYPELYLLEGGYKSFYENFKSYCEPQTYKPMLHAEHLHDFKHFRSKAKSWEVSKHHILHKYSSEQFQQKQQAAPSVNQQNQNQSNEQIEQIECVTQSRKVIKMKNIC